MKYGAVILAGGKSCRMGVPKSELQLNGTRFLDKLVYELSSLQEVMISVDDEKLHPEIEYPMVSDVVSGCGPMGGLYAALIKCTSDALAVVPCDVPLFSKALADKMCRCLDCETRIVRKRAEGGHGKT